MFDYQSNQHPFIKSFISKLQYVNLLLASKSETCLICEKKRSGHAWLCQRCLTLVPWLGNPQCLICGRQERCFDCSRRKQSYFVCSRSAVRYNTEMKTWLAQYKYRQNERLAPLFIDMLSTAYMRLIKELAQHHQTIDCMTYIPISEERLEERGFNQSEQFARGLANQYRLPVHSLLLRKRHTHKQSYKTRNERLRDLEGVFTIDLSGLNLLKKSIGVKNILLVDDVYTTGSTINECAKAIHLSYPSRIYALTWAR